MDLVSVIVPVYNGGDFLEDTLQSLIEQTYDNLEIIVVDDSSTDDSLAISKRFALNDPRVAVFSNELEKGACTARNYGFSRSSGELVAFHDADDISKPNRISEQVAFLSKFREYIGVGSFAEIIDESGKVIGIRVVPATRERILWFELTRPAFAFVHSSLLVRREFFITHGLFDQQFQASQDKALYIRSTEKCSFRNLEMPLLQYRVHDSQISKTKATEQMCSANDIVSSKIIDMIGSRDSETIDRFVCGEMKLSDIPKYVRIVKTLIRCLVISSDTDLSSREIKRVERNLCFGGARFQSRCGSMLLGILFYLTV